MDGYESIRETAERWGVSQRLVQKLCTEGRIQGAQKFSGAWAIPTDAAKPADLRRSRHREGDKTESVEPPIRPPVQTAGKTLMPLMNTPFVPGQCLAAVEAMEEGPQRDIALAEYHYFSGHPEEAAGEAERYFSSPDLVTRLSACLIYAFANLSLGCIEQARSALGEVERTLRAAGEAAPAFQAASGFVAATAAVLLHLPLPDGLPPVEGFMQQLPPGLRAFALYVQAHYLYLQGDYARSAGVAEATLAIGGSRYPIPAIYLNLVAVMDYMSLKQTDRAESHLLAAWELARPDDLIEGFGEHHGLLGGMLESVIKREWPEEFRRIIAITYRFSWGWRRIHNPKTGDQVADNLTTTEFAVAMLAARGWTNEEIAGHMGISSHTVKRHLAEAKGKLHVNTRQELGKYMLQ